MPTLPTLTVTQSQADRLLATFGSVDAYLSWLITKLKAAVMEAEIEAIRQQAQAAIEAKRAEFEVEMQGIGSA